jgi:hypothetical protein
MRHSPRNVTVELRVGPFGVLGASSAADLIAKKRPGLQGHGQPLGWRLRPQNGSHLVAQHLVGETTIRSVHFVSSSGLQKPYQDEWVQTGQ